MRLILIGGVMLIVIIFMIIFIAGLNRKKEKEEVKDVISYLSEIDNNKNKYSGIKIFQFERYFVEKFNLEKDKIKLFIYAERMILLAAVILSYFLFGAVGICFCASAIVLMVLDSKLKDEIYRSGVTRIDKTVAFMDFFTPQIASGHSASQSFLKYIEKLPNDSEVKPLLIEYYDRKQENDYTYETPDTIKDITAVYENALYNEEMGADDYLYIIQQAKDDLFQKSVYYTDYNSKCGEVLKPIQLAYYVGVPVIIILLFGTLGSFWFTIWGWVTAIALVVLFLLFKIMVNKLAINTMREIL